MKTTRFQWVFTLVFTFVLSMILSKTTAQIYQIPSSYANATDTVKQFFKGDTLVIAQDSAYLLNQMQLTHYKLLMKFKVDVSRDNANLQQIFNDLVKSVTNNLAKLERLNKDMKINADSTGAIGKRLADVTYSNALRADSVLASAQVKLKEADAYLKQADLHLQKATDYLKKEKKDRFWRSLKWAAVGTGVGAILGFIIKGSLK